MGFQFVTQDKGKCALSILAGICIMQNNFREINELFVGTNEIVHYLQVSVLSGSP